MRKLVALAVVAAAVTALVCGCSKTADKVVVRITDNEGKLEPRTVTAGYVNDRLESMMAPYIPDIAGDDGKKRLLEDIIRKELLVIQALRLGLDKDPQQETSREFYEQQHAEDMLREELIYKPAELTQEQVEKYYSVRDATFQIAEISVATKEEADAVYKRVTEGGEDFHRVASEVSISGTAKEGGRLPVMEWAKYHPLVREAIRDFDRDAVTPPFQMGNWFIYKVLSRKPAVSQQPLEGQHLMGITAEARDFERGITEYHLYDGWMKAANLVFDQEVLALAAQRTEEMVRRDVPEMGTPADAQTRMGRAAAKIVPEFTDEEKARVLLTYKVGGKEKSLTLGGYQELVNAADGIETPKEFGEGGPIAIDRFVRGRVHAELIEREIEARGYRKSREMQQYLAERAEELMVKLLYDAEVVKKVVDPTPPEVLEYFESHRSDFAEPPSVDVQHVIVPTEEMANQVRQQLVAGQMTFDDAAEKYSKSGWLKANKGIVSPYYQGDSRFGYLQDIAFTLEPGQISEPVAAPGGFAIARVLKKNPGQLLTLEQVGDTVTQTLVGLRREERLTQLLDEIRATVTVETLDENLQYVRDTAEVLKEKKGQGVTVTSQIGGK